MTCIAWDGKTLAADKRATNGTARNTVTKIYRAGDVLVGVSGDLAFGMQLLEWVMAGRNPDTFPASQREEKTWQPMLVIEADGTMARYEQTPYPIRWQDAFGAIGSGRDYALAAMHLGKTAEEAVAVATAFDPGCGNGIDTLTLIEDKEPNNAE